MTIQSGSPEHITKSWKYGGRETEGYRPEYITFTGTCDEFYNDLQITDKSAVECADRVKGLI